jgi:hypothetical protein
VRRPGIGCRATRSPVPCEELRSTLFADSSSRPWPAHLMEYIVLDTYRHAGLPEISWYAYVVMVRAILVGTLVPYPHDLNPSPHSVIKCRCLYSSSPHPLFDGWTSGNSSQSGRCHHLSEQHNNLCFLTQRAVRQLTVRRKPSIVRTPWLLMTSDPSVELLGGRLRGASIRCSRMAQQVDSLAMSLPPTPGC